jgi:hypothetical protein
MSNESIAAVAVANGPHTAAPPSFDGHGWLVVVNLVFMTTSFVVYTMIAVDMMASIWRNRDQDSWRHPVTIWRLIGMLYGIAGFFRFGLNAALLWGWNPDYPRDTALLLTLQRVFDPIAALLCVVAIGMFKVSERGMVDQLRRRPFPLDMWASLPMLKGPAMIGLLSLIAAVGVVSTR